MIKSIMKANTKRRDSEKFYVVIEESSGETIAFSHKFAAVVIAKALQLSREGYLAVVRNEKGENISSFFPTKERG